MKKTRGKKAKASSHRRLNKPNVSFFKKLLPFIIIFAMLLAAVVIFNAVSTGNAITGLPTDSTSTETDFLSQPVSDFGKTIINVLNTGAKLDGLNRINDQWKDLIIAVIVFAILLVGMYEILTLTSIFGEPWAVWIITIGLTIIASLTGIVRNLTALLIQFAGGLGAIAITLEIIVAILIFIGLVLGSNSVAKFAAKRRGQKHYLKAIDSASKAGGAIKGLRILQKEFERK